MVFDNTTNMCDITVCPSTSSIEIQTKAKLIAEKAIEALDGYGIFGVEMFVTKENEVLINIKNHAYSYPEPSGNEHSPIGYNQYTAKAWWQMFWVTFDEQTKKPGLKRRFQTGFYYIGCA